MQVNATVVEGLRREFEVVVPVSELGDRLTARLNEIQGQVQIKGFRPGKVPVNHLRRLYGKSTMAEIVQAVINEVARDTMSERGERAALQPDFKLPEEEGAADKILNGEADLTYIMSYEILPAVEIADLSSIAIERPVVEVSDEEVDAEVTRLAEGSRTFSPKEGKSEAGDQMTIAYVGKVDGELFPGGSDENATVRLGTSQGLAAGESKTITVTFPEDYGARHLAGKEASFDITVKEVAAPDAIVVDDELAKRVGLESLDQLKDAIRQQIQTRYGMQTRQKVKRQLLDQLDALHQFDLPPKMVEQEFDNIWRQIVGEMGQQGRTFESEDTTEEAAREDYHKIAERRVRLGLVLSEIGEKSKIEVTEPEVQRALQAQLRQFPGREKQLIDYYRSNPDAIASLRAPIFEEKVVDYVLEQVKVADKTVTVEELMKDDEEDEAAATATATVPA